MTLLIILNMYIFIGIVRVFYFRQMYMECAVERFDEAKLGKFRRFVTHAVALTLLTFTWPLLVYSVIVKMKLLDK